MSQAQLNDFYSGKKILITGGLGFIGSTLAHRLVAMHADVLLVDALIPEYGGNPFNIHGIKDKVSVNISDVRDRSSMDRLVQGQDCIFNLAGTLSHIDSMRDPFTDLEINCVAQLSILEAVRHNNPTAKIVFAGTRGQYGKVEKNPINEAQLMQPIDVNGINNMAGEWYHILYNNTYGIPAASLRLTNTYGPRHQMRHHKQGIINWFIRQLLEDKPIKIFGDGKQVRDINYVDDVVEALLQVMMHDACNGQVFNIGGEPLSLKALVELMIEVQGSGTYELVDYPADMQPIEVGDYIADYSKFQKLTGWQPHIKFQQGLQQSFEYYRQHQSHYW